ncbi:hypothetical protein ACJIZ3_010602 [Penstemon smallii]|uniref:ATP-dependent DNA helicase n=1 Tax=Penstemon smallii TaxID=265156 RepID=A0ABD3UH27_9LAMI
MYIKVETSRLDYYKSEQFQQELRVESLQGITDSLHVDGQTDPSQIGQKVILPSSFIGGPRDMRKRYVNAMALVERFGKPDLFLTMTCNPNWKEIRKHLLPSQLPHDRPDLIARVFKAKLEEFKDDIVRKKIFGEVAAYIYVVEYQKRGLPHAHWIIILTPPNKIACPSTYDHIISAELPDTSHPFLREYVVKHMMHGPCGSSNMKCSCMRNGECKYHYPKDFAEVTCNGLNSYPIYKRRDNGMSAVVRNFRLDNRHVIPYSPYFLLKLDCHINVEVVTTEKLVKYLYKYVYKGHARSAFNVVGQTVDDKYDEIQAYQEGRYICAPEACWRMFAFPMSEMYPPVIVMPVHLPNHQPLRFGLRQSLEQVASNPLAGKTMLTEFFEMNASNANSKNLNLLYKEYPEYFVWEGTKHKWKPRQRQVVVGRLCSVSPMEGERYFERLLLINVRCPSSFDDLMTVGGVKYTTFRETAVRRGLLQSDHYIDACLAEAASFQMPYCLRVLFAMLLVYGIAGDTQNLWDKYYECMSEDFVRMKIFTDVEVLCKTVDAIELVLTSMDKTILDFPIKFPFQYPSVRSKISRDYEHECSINVSEEDIQSVHQLNTEQLCAFKIIIERVNHKKAGLFFLDGPGGTGKTFLYRALLANVRSAGGIALAVASSGVAASLLPGGRTAHSRFKLPLHHEDKPMGKISKQSSAAKMIVKARLIIWDEASMANRHSIEALDNLLADLCGNKLAFGGKVVLFGGDFRQTLPIVIHGTREDMIAASIVSSKIWQNVTRICLTKNMRAREDPEFISFLLSLGNGQIPFIFDDNIRIPSSMLIPFVDAATSLNALIQYVYPSMDVFLTDPYSMVDRAILTPKNDSVGEINDLLMDRFPGEAKEYVSFNRTNDATQQVEFEDYLNSVAASGLPPHILKLKKNCPIMLLRNINPVQGLCNGTRLICRELADNFIKAEIAVGDLKGTEVLIPRIPLESSDKLSCSIPFKRMQIPVRPCFAMTINKAQGQTLDMVGIYLRQPVFSHGQLYVGLSRVRNSKAIKILIHPDFKGEGTVDYTNNIVFHDIFALAAGFCRFVFNLFFFHFCEFMFIYPCSLIS